MKLWDKGININSRVEYFTVGNDRDFDKQLVPFDIVGTIAHITMLQGIGLINLNERSILVNELKKMYKNAVKNGFEINPEQEDVHSQLEWELIKKVGEVGKKIHSGRSRNDQVLLDIKLYLRNEVKEITKNVENLFEQLIHLSQTYQKVLMPGYTHLQIAMPSSFGLWFGAYAESLADDLELLLCSYNQINQNPLGSAAGYGSSFPINRQLTTDLLGFKNLHHNVVYAQMNRGKTEQLLSFALSSIATTLSKMAMDMCLYNSQNFGFVAFPDEFTTGSSIMPHKKNPDVWELVRGRCNRIKAIPNELALLLSNLPSGYHRDLQLTKEILFPAINEIKDCIEISELMLSSIIINTQIFEDKKYNSVFSVEKVNELVLNGVPFRDAYKKVARDAEIENFDPKKVLEHLHEGSIGNLCNDQISNKFKDVIKSFDFNIVQNKIEKLIS